MSRRRVFANSADVVVRARRFVTDGLGDLDADLLDTVGLLVSELATNCVRHTAGEFTVEVERTDDRLRVQVIDHGAGVPTVRSPAPTEPSGRGLRIVEQLADDFGVDYSAPGAPQAKTVWFEMWLADRSARAARGAAEAGVTPHATRARDVAARPARPTGPQACAAPAVRRRRCSRRPRVHPVGV